MTLADRKFDALIVSTLDAQIFGCGDSVALSGSDAAAEGAGCDRDFCGPAANAGLSLRDRHEYPRIFSANGRA